MTAVLHFDVFTPTAFTSQQTPSTGYDVSNTVSPSVRKHWLSSVGANGSNDDWIQHDYGSNRSVVAVAIQSVLQGSGSILVGTGTPPGTTYGTIDASSIGMSGHGIRKGSWSGAATARYVRVDFTNATDARGSGVYASYASALMELGALYVYGSTLNLPVDPLLDSSVQYLYPQTAEKLPNGQTLPIERGPPRARITLRFRAGAAHDIEKVARICRAQVCWLDLGVSNDRSLQWPVRMVEDNFSREFTRPRREPVVLVFEEAT